MRISAILMAFAAATLVLAVGCALNGPDRGGIGADTAGMTPLAAGGATVAFAVRVTPDDAAGETTPGASTQVEPALRWAVASATANATQTGVIFRVITLNIGNRASPTSTLEKFVPITGSGIASAVFTNLPTNTTIAQVDGVNVNIAGFQRFHGALDLLANITNYITVHPVGSNFRADLVAHCLEHITVNPVLFGRITGPCAARAVSLLSQLDRQSPTIQQDIINTFSRSYTQPTWRLSIDEIRQAQIRMGIAATQGSELVYGWTPGDTYITQNYSEDEAMGLCGLATFTDINIAAAVRPFSVRADVTLPAQFSWLNKDGRNWLPPVRNQGVYSTCVAFAACAALESMMLIQANVAGVDLAEWHVFRAGTQGDTRCLTGGGWEFPAAIDFLTNVGVVAEQRCPYYTIPNYAEPPLTEKRHRITSALRAGNSTAIKQALLNGPLLGGMMVYQDFLRYTGGKYVHVSGSAMGMHAVVIVGWDDTTQSWICRNSWSTGWGEQGNFRIGFNDMQPSAYLLNYAFTNPAPNPPATLAAVPGNGEITLTWPVATSATAYHLYWSTSANVTRQNGTPLRNVTSPYVHRGLQNGQTYYYVVTAENGTGESSDSTVAQAMPVDEASIVPGNVMAVPEDGIVTLTWNPVHQATAYNLYYSTTPDPTKFTAARIPGGVTSPYVHSGLTNGTTYYYIVTAIVGRIESLDTATASCRPWPQPPVPPGQPTADAGRQTITVTWPAVAGATSYNLYCSLQDTVSKTNGTQTVNVTSPYTITNLANGTPYHVVVTSLNAAGESAESPKVSAVPVLPAPTNAAATGGLGQCVVTWNPVAGATGYHIYHATSANVSKTTGEKFENRTSPALLPATNGVTHYYCVTAVDGGMESAESAVVSAVPHLSTPTGLAATPGNKAVTLSWNPVTGASYNLYYRTSAGVTMANGTRIASVTSPFTHQPLNNGVPAYYVITASDTTEETVISTEVTATPRLPTPTGLTAYAGPNAIRFWWNAVPNATGYKLYWSTNGGVNRSNGTAITTTAPTCVLPGVSLPNTYHVVVTATDATDESVESAALATTPAAVSSVDLGGVSLDLVEVRPGTFSMGSAGGEADETNVHPVTLTRRLLVGRTEVNRDQFGLLRGYDPSQLAGDGTYPVNTVSWVEAISFCNEMSAQLGLTSVYGNLGTDATFDANANGFRLLTESEWEYVCRAGSTTNYSWGDTIDLSYCWINDNSAGSTHAVAQKTATLAGLFDTHGNVWEWCWDRYGSAYPTTAQADPSGPTTGSNRVTRGGCYSNFASHCRSSMRNQIDPSSTASNVGFRVCRNAP